MYLKDQLAIPSRQPRYFRLLGGSTEPEVAQMSQHNQAVRPTHPGEPG